MWQGFLLGLASGSSCIAYCAPVLVPYFLGEGKSVQRNYLELLKFLAGRLLGYLLFGVFAWFIGRLILGDGSILREILLGFCNLLLAGLLFCYALFRLKTVCAAEAPGGILRKLRLSPALWPIALGFLTGLNLCPPFLLAFLDSAQRSLVGSLLFFLVFFIGTSLYFLPVPFVGFLNRFPAVQFVGKMTALVLAGYYFYTGLIMFGGGLISL